ncbi:glyoxylate/hydroxypyruvate reductase A [Variovorax sp. PCZ-1]|uniref:2-hydroxyacid dehydrogenase n=1 Tax=Variovorax sp. PCZ-1 TaxID=2835533 RepID=UPI001BCB2470|nr:glyoxylate/hydroxypyruvate reductase A [Variovorax sp. PCZ-1]MBS7807596.1 glyoxylate/hydroxypyruvate reductase A [Variovorax sp. PCZ-1]
MPHQNSPKLAFCCPTIDAQPWADAMAKALPEAQIQIWPDCTEQADYAITWAPTQAFFDAQPQLKAVFALGAGVDGLLKLRLPESLAVVRIEDGGMAAQMQDYVTHALLRHVRRFDQYAQDIRAGKWIQYPAQDHASFPVGILGLGELGSKIAERVRDIGFPVVGWSKSPKTMEGIRCFSGEELYKFLSMSRVLVCALPLTPHTQDILNEQHLSLLKPGAYLINIARGAHLVEEDLLKLLASGHMAGACLDVMRTEPAPANHPFRSHPQITLTPHISAMTLLAPSIAQISQKIMSLRNGQAITGVIQRGRGY